MLQGFLGFLPAVVSGRWRPDSSMRRSVTRSRSDLQLRGQIRLSGGTREGQGRTGDVMHQDF